MKDGRLLTDACKPVSAITYETWTKRLRPKLEISSSLARRPSAKSCVFPSTSVSALGNVLS